VAQAKGPKEGLYCQESVQGKTRDVALVFREHSWQVASSFACAQIACCPSLTEEMEVRGLVNSWLTHRFLGDSAKK
jgi:hypothetical protein